MLVWTCCGLAWTILLAGVVFAAMALSKGNSDDVGFTVGLVALILGPTMLVAGLITWLGLFIRSDQTARRSS